MDYVNEKVPLIPSGIEPATFRFVAQHLNHCDTAVPNIYIYIQGHEKSMRQFGPKLAKTTRDNQASSPVMEENINTDLTSVMWSYIIPNCLFALGHPATQCALLIPLHLLHALPLSPLLS